MSLWLPCDLTTIYRLDTKWGIDLVSDVLLAQMTSNIFRYVRLRKNFINDFITTVCLSHEPATTYRPDTKWGQGLVSQVLQVQLTYNFVTLLDMLGWRKNFTNDIIMIFTWPSYNLQTRYKIRTRFKDAREKSTLWSI